MTAPTPHDHAERVQGCFRCEMGADEVTVAVECPLSQRVDGKKHSWVWASDGPYVECHYCGELQDAMNGTVITPGRRS